MKKALEAIKIWLWAGDAVYGARFGKYYGFNLWNVVSAHYNTRGEISLGVGDWFKIWQVW